MKKQIAEQLKLDARELIMRRGGKAGTEIKEGKSQTISSHNFMNGSSVYIEKGIPSIEGEFRICLSLAERTGQQEPINFYNFQEIGEYPLNGGWKASEAKEEVCRLAKKVLGVELNPKLVRLRERIQNRLTKIYREKTLREQCIIEKKQIAVEVIGAEENLEVKEQVVMVRLWDQ